MSTLSDKIIQACKDNFAAHSNDCSGFVKAVATDLNVTLTGLADNIVDEIQTGDWTVLNDGIDAKAKADDGWFVIGGLKGAENVPAQSHGHVVVVVSGPLDPTHNAYPTAYWGRLGSVGKENTPVNFAWNADSRDKVIYAAVQIS
ncbi:hypothetical protein [Mucilaginibacter flavus]|uniref:hypothetical protein n=1 Tax=Mucilaginibacter flavus TaxID=931504 RepID=UPI0025B554BE|nr:hypothetical protein [Mucilaginibacter flavus]MDN3580804.1 hypothetical protein [Mucilaginibacter flavus]